MQSQAAELATKLSEAEAALERNNEVHSNELLSMLCSGIGVPSRNHTVHATALQYAGQSGGSLYRCSFHATPPNGCVHLNLQANSALSLVEREGFEAHLASAREAAEAAKAAAAAAEARAKTAEQGRAAAEAARDTAERLRQETEAEAQVRTDAFAGEGARRMWHGNIRSLC